MSSQLKSKLQAEKENLIDQLQSYKSKDPLADPEQSRSRTVDDAITVSEGHDRITATRLELKQRLAEVEDTLEKISAGKYGYCEKCSKKIDAERLNAIDTARLCLECVKKVKI